MGEFNDLDGSGGALSAQIQSISDPSRYTLLEPLGRGGNGVVYAAHDKELDRRVAIKLVRAATWASGDDDPSDEAQARLLREARALARLAHPNVAQVYDVGEYGPGELQPSLPGLADDDELPAERGVFVVMELVDGESLRRWLARGPHPWKAALDVMVASGLGLAAAHDGGLIHRDFKPGNVLMGNDGRVRVVDFGLARAAPMQPSAQADPSDTGDATVASDSVTRRGTVVGTPAYMAPEQHRREPATAAADQFAFCAVLYEALCGKQPFAGPSLAQLRNQKESQRVVVPPAGAAAPRWLWSLIARGLSADPARRFGSMRELLDRIEAGRRAGRIKLAAAIVAPIVLLGSVGLAQLGVGAAAGDDCADQRAALIGVWDEPTRAATEAAFVATGKPYAEAAWASAAARIDAYVARWGQLRAQACEAQHGTEQAQLEIGNWSAACLDGARDALESVQEELARADARAVEGAVEIVGRLPDLERCGSREAAMLELQRSAEDRAKRGAIASKLTNAELALSASRHDRALERAKAALAAAKSQGLSDMEGRALFHIARIQLAQGDTAAAEASARTAWTAGEGAADPDGATRAQVLLSHLLGGHEERLAEADALLGPLQARVTRRAKQDLLTLELYRAVGSVRERQGKYEEALHAFEQAQQVALAVFGEDSLEAAQAAGAIGLVHFQRGRYRLAGEQFAKAHAGYVGILGESHPRSADALGRSALALAQGGNLPGAIERQQRVVKILERSLSSRHRRFVNAVTNLSVMLHKAGREEEALRVGEQALELEAALTSTDDPRYGLKLGNHALVLRALGRGEEALEALENQLSLYRKAYAPDHVNLGTVHLNLGSVLLGLGRLERARKHADRALAINEATYGDSHDAVASTLSLSCAIELQRGRPGRARPLCKRGLAIYEALDGFEDQELLGDLAFGLARASPRTEARDLALRALRAYRALGHSEAAAVEAWMREQGHDFALEGAHG